MFRRIVVADYAGNEGRDALALAAALARPQGGRIVVVQAMPLVAGRDAPREMGVRMAAARDAMRALFGPDARAEYRPLPGRPFAASVHAVAIAEDADVIVAGQSRRADGARVPRGRPGAPRRPRAVPGRGRATRAGAASRVRAGADRRGVDGTRGAALALAAGGALARWGGARLRVLAVATAADSPPPGRVALPGDPARALLGQASAGADALVVAGRSRSTARVMASASCPVWVVPPTAAAALGRAAGVDIAA